MQRARRHTTAALTAGAVFLTLVANALFVPSASAAASNPAPCGRGGPDTAISVDAQSGTRAHHPLCLRMHGRNILGTPQVTSGTPTGYTPATVKTFLNLSGDGAGQTIAIVDAYDHPSIASDLAAFDSTFGLPAPPSFKKVSQTGATRGLPATNANWALEIALDVEWAHALAPAASILLVEAKSTTVADMDAAIAYASKQKGVSVISNSWGTAEFSGQTGVDKYCQLATAVCVVSTGDNGNPGTYQAYNPYVLAVGGTTLSLATNADGSVSAVDEQSWSGTGGGVSLYEAKPAYQNAVNPYTKRGTADVSYDADPATGFAVYDSVTYDGQSGWFQMGGTSAGAPQWSAILAVTNQLRKASGKQPLSAVMPGGKSAQTAIYSLTTGLADITTGAGNGTCGVICTAAPGFDFLTGLGSPRAGIDLALKAIP